MGLWVAIPPVYLAAQLSKTYAYSSLMSLQLDKAQEIVFWCKVWVCRSCRFWQYFTFELSKLKYGIIEIHREPAYS